MRSLIADIRFSPRWFRNWSMVLLGASLMAAGYVFFIIPHKIVPGGVYGLSIITHHMFGLPTGATAFVMNLPLIAWGIKELGPRFGIKTILGQLIASSEIDLLSWLWGSEPLSHDVLVSSLFGGALIGVGLAFIFKAKATTGGSDIVANIVAKRTGSPVGRNIIIIDTVVVGAGVLAFGAPEMALYALVTLFVLGKVLDATMEGPNYQKAVFIISAKQEEIRHTILHVMGRGGTLFPAKGLFLKDDRPVILTAVNRRELAILQEHVRAVDPTAFVVVFDAREILGEGFRPLNEPA